MKKILFLLIFSSLTNISIAQNFIKPAPCVKDTFYLDLTGKILNSGSLTTNPDWVISVNCLMKATIETKLIFEPEEKGSNPNPNLACEINILKDGNQLYNMMDSKGALPNWEQTRQEKIKLDHISKNFQMAVQLKLCTTTPSNDARLKMKYGSYILVILQPHQ
jgi:hypothetical protein